MMASAALVAGLLAGASLPPDTRWMTAEDYPAAALAAGRHGTAIIGFDVTEQGQVEHCRILSSTGTPSLDEASCAMFTRRARFTAAVDDQGKPRRMSTSHRIHWVILGMKQGPADLPIGGADVTISSDPLRDQRDPGRRMERGATRLSVPLPSYPGKALKEGRRGRTDVMLVIDRRGRVSDCSVIRTSGSADLDEATCRFAREKMRYTPAADAAGKPMFTTDLFNINWKF